MENTQQLQNLILNRCIELFYLNRETDANKYVVQIARGKQKKTIEIVHNSALSILLPISRFK